MSAYFEAFATYLPNRYGGVLKFYGEEATGAFWDKIWEELEEQVNYRRAETGHLPHQLKRTFLRWAPPGARVLEAGCGLAEFTVATRALGFETEGIDYAPRVVERLRTRYPEIPFAVADVRNLTAVANDTYDAIYSPGVVEHFEEGPEPILIESFRVLKPGGVLVLSTPCFNVLLRMMRRLGGFRRKREGAFFQYAYSEAHMSSILTELGFDVVQVHQYGVLLTLTEHVALIGRVPFGPLRRYVAGGLDSLPVMGRAGHTCIWVARKPAG